MIFPLTSLLISSFTPAACDDVVLFDDDDDDDSFLVMEAVPLVREFCNAAYFDFNSPNLLCNVAM